MRMGVLALQGGFSEHAACLRRLGAEVVLLRQKHHLNHLDGLIIPGGESTAMATLLKRFDMFDRLKSLLEEGLPVWGTCAGAILLGASPISEAHDALNIVPVRIQRNAYGPQRDSFQADLIQDVAPGSIWRGLFIRAPKIISYDPPVKPLVRLASDRSVVGVQSGRCMLTTFHPELLGLLDLHRYFLTLAGAVSSAEVL